MTGVNVPNPVTLTWSLMGYSRKYPPPPPLMDDTELGTEKFQDFQKRQ